MNVLVIGSGGREHAIADAFARSNKVNDIFVAPGNAGIATHYKTIELTTHTEILDFCSENNINMVFVGPEIQIERGLGDFLRENGIPVVAPSKAAGRIESSKAFAKNLMQQIGIPTSLSKTCFTYDEGLQLLQEFDFPVVIKADGLAAGKGVVIVNNEDEAQQTLRAMMLEKKLGNAGNTVIIEEFLEGWEVSLFAVTDGTDFKTMLFTQDHKQLWDHDKGPNTGGMGAFAPVPEAEPYRYEIEATIVAPVLKEMRDSGYLYQGILYCGLMITKTGPKVIEFNCRFGDPETQVVLPLLETDFADVATAITNRQVKDLTLSWMEQTAVCAVLASDGYPFEYKTGFEIIGYDDCIGQIYFAGVKTDQDRLVTSSGRVLNVVGLGSDLSHAREMVYRDVEKIHFQGKIYRTDIGLRSNQL
ncbi:MAG: phosphoribosylamine--glycine ligase [Candidatus Cloacimonadaceae bacterium]|nr:phosphoribosylamine--glycine ligase [Candidatus Cloacimonadaceae bacterium]